MPQPETAGGSDDLIVPAELSPEDRLNAAFEDAIEEPQDETPPPEGEPEGDEPTADDIEDEAEERPPIDPPISWTAEDKAKFSELPRELQETVGKREAEREKFVQSKAQEAAQARDAARTEALQFAEQLRAETVERLNHYAKQFEVDQPDARLIVSNPEAYAQQLATYQYAQAQREQAQRDADKARDEQAQYQAALQQHEAQQFRQRLQSELPEAFEASGQINKGFIDALAATAETLGYDAHAIDNASVEELKALKAVSEIKAKADKYDALQRKKMERVRAGKTLPPVSKPGVAREAGAAAKSQYAADRQAMRNGDKDATQRALDAHFNR
jgi:hypothetical protein